jgi:4-hydroxybenzoate polyprenyltransferase
MIKIEHTLFALPFALSGAVIAANGIPNWNILFWIGIAVLGGRSGAMGLNRVADAKIDAKNPRTANREIPSGKLSVKEGWIYVILSFIIYEFASYMLNPLCFKLSPIPLFVFLIYSYTKRFTYLCHVVLGVALGLAPIGAWVAVKGNFNIGIILLGFAVMVWVIGFDVIYAVQDIDFDKKEGLYSIPVLIGITNSLYLARLLHLIAFVIFFYIKFYFGLGWLYLTGVFISGYLMFKEHKMIKPGDLKKLDMAFFNMNAYISLCIFIFTFFDRILQK